MNRLSPSLIISILALFVALSGTAYAAVKINGKNIKKGTVSGTALKTNTLGGAQIKESRLGKVPTATRADSAASLGGVSAAGFVKGSGATYSELLWVPDSTTTLLVVPGLIEVQADCIGGSQVALSLTGLTAGLRYTVTRSIDGGSDTFGGAINSVGAGLGWGHVDEQTVTGNVWHEASGRVATVSAASTLCRASAVVTVSE